MSNASIIIHPRTSALTGLISAYAQACVTADLSHAPSRINVQRFLLPKLKAHRAELLQGINADRRSSNRTYLPGVMEIVSEVRSVIADVSRRLREIHLAESAGTALTA